MPANNDQEREIVDTERKRDTSKDPVEDPRNPATSPGGSQGAGRARPMANRVSDREEAPIENKYDDDTLDDDDDDDTGRDDDGDTIPEESRDLNVSLPESIDGHERDRQGQPRDPETSRRADEPYQGAKPNKRSPRGDGSEV